MNKKTTTSNDPWAPAQPYIVKGLQNSGAVFDQQQPKLNAFSSMQMDSYNRLAPGAEAGIAGAHGQVNDTLSGKYLNGNPYMDGMIGQTNRDIANNVNSQFESSGRYGSGMHADILARQTATADNALRYQNYNDERTRQQAAVGQASGLMQGSQGLLNNAADLPWLGVGALNGNVRQASNGYGTQTQTTRDPVGQVTGLIGAGASAAGAIWSDARLKDISPAIGQTPDGITIHPYTYKGDTMPQVGVIAQDVLGKRPDAVSSGPGGLLSVDYSKLGLPDPTTMASMVHPSQGGTAGTPQAGLANTPDGAGPAPKKPGFLDRLMTPDTSTTMGKLGLLGQYLMAANGSPFQAVGQGLIEQRQNDQKMAQGRAMMQLESAKTASALHAANKPTFENINGTSIQHNADGTSQVNGTYDKAPQAIETVKAMGIDPTSPHGQDLVTQFSKGYQYTQPVLAMKLDNQLQGINATGDMRTRVGASNAAAQSQGRIDSRAPPRASSKPPVYMAGPGGKIMKWVP